MISQEKQLEILFSHFKGLSYREIARRTGCDPRTAKKYVEHPELIGKPRQSSSHTSIIDPFMDKIKTFLDEEYGYEYRASWIFDKIKACGYSGSYELVKRAVRQIKGSKQQLAYIRYETMPGEQAQVDFAEFQVELPDGQIKKYYLFAMILGYSRKLFGCLLERCDLPNFLEAHIAAFEYFGGVPREILYDRMRNVFVRKLISNEHRECEPTQFTQSLVTLAVHYGFRPRVAPAYAAWVKGKIEKPNDYLREGFWRGYSFTNLDTANHDLMEWLAEKEHRIHGTTHERIDVRFDREKPHLGALPPTSCDVSLRLTRKVSSDCRISVDGNRFMVSHTLVGRKLTVRLKDKHLRIFYDNCLVEEYDTPEGKGHVVGLDRGYYEALLADQKLQERKFANRGKRKRKGRARIKPTISPSLPQYPVVVEPVNSQVGTPLHSHAISLAKSDKLDIVVQQRSVDIYASIGGEVTSVTGFEESWRSHYGG